MLNAPARTIINKKFRYQSGIGTGVHSWGSFALKFSHIQESSAQQDSLIELYLTVIPIWNTV